MHQKGHRVCFIVSAIPDECDYIGVEILFNWLGFFLKFVCFWDLKKHPEKIFFFNLVSIFVLILIIVFGERQTNLELSLPLILWDQTL